jgi:hypothetical protein
VGAYLKAGTFHDSSVTVSEAKVGYRVGRYGSTMVIVAVNESEKDDQPLSGSLPTPPPTYSDVSFTLPAGVVAMSVDVALDGLNGGAYTARSSPVTRTAGSRSQFTDTFAPYAVHIYSVQLQ